MTRRLTPMSAVTIAIAIVTAGLTHAGAAPLVAAQEWSDGACSDNVGITVVIDFQELGGGVNVRCAPGPASNGLDALDRADIAWEGTLRFPGFVCRIAGLPTPADDACANTPPANAFWGYWIAPRGGEWCYANVGPASRTPPPGSIEGWSFALDKAAANIPPPRFDVPDAVQGQAPNPVNGSECTTAAASGTTGTTVRPASTTSSTTSTSTSTSTSSSTTTSTTTTSTTPTVAPGDAAPTPPPAAAAGGDDDGSVAEAASASTVVNPTTTLATTQTGTGIGIDNEAVRGTTASSTRPRPAVDDDGGDVAAAGEPGPTLFEASEQAAVDARVAEPGTVDLSDDRRNGSGFGLSSILAIVVIAAVAAAGVLAARRRTRPLRVET